MLKNLGFTLLLASSACALASCAASGSATNASAQTHETGKVAFSVMCQSHHDNTVEKDLSLGQTYSSAALQIDQVNAGFFHNVSKMASFVCNGRPQYQLVDLPVGQYKIDSMNIANGTVDGLNISFSTVANRVTYIGRLTINAKGPTTSFGGGRHVYFTVNDQRTNDLAYFKSHYPNISPSDYVVNLATQAH